MKIALDVSQMVYQGTGVGRYVGKLAEALLKVGGADYLFYAGALRQINYFRSLSQKDLWDRAEWKIYPFSPRMADIVFNQADLPIDPFIGKVDIFHSSDWTQPRTKAHRITTVHDLAFKLFPDTVDPTILTTQERRMKKVVKEVEIIVADSESTKNDLVKIYQIDNSKIKVVYPGIDSIFTRSKSNDIERVKTKYQLPSKYFLTLGTKEPRKNLPRLIKAVSGLSLPLVITGRYGWGSKLSPSSHVIETGFVDDTDLPALYSGATVFVYPSLYEGFGFPVGEAMACGVPVVTSNISSLPEVGGTAAIYVDPMDPKSIRAGISQALMEKVKRSNAGLKQVGKFTWEKTANEMLNIYNKLTNI